MKGDRIRYHGEPGEVEFIAEAGDPDTSDLVEQSGGGCMIIAANSEGSLCTIRTTTRILNWSPVR
jgi:hypothetical protein